MQSNRARGITLMLLAVGIFSVMDMCLKVLSTEFGSLQIATLRGAASLPFVLASVIARRRLADLRRRRIGLHVVRGLLSVLMISAFAYAVRLMSLSNVYTLFMVAPLMVTAISVPLLGERVRKGAWIAIFVGLAGTLVLLRPSTTGINLVGALAALLCAACYTVSYVLARVMSRTESADGLVFWVLAMMALFSGLLGWRYWLPIPPAMWGWIGVIGVTGAIAQQCITRAFMLAPASVIAPFEYTALVWGALFDWLIWSTHPGLADVTRRGLDRVQRGLRDGGRRPGGRNRLPASPPNRTPDPRPRSVPPFQPRGEAERAADKRRSSAALSSRL